MPNEDCGKDAGAGPASAPASTLVLLGRIHAALVGLIIGLRPLIWDGEPGQTAELAWRALPIIGLAAVLAETAAGWRPAWRWSWRGLLFALLALLLLPACLGAAVPAAGADRAAWLLAQVLAAAYLMQAVPGRERVAWGALLAGLAAMGLLGLGQKTWVLPAMAAAHASGDPSFAVLGAHGGDLADRIAYGGVFTTFTVSNQLGAVLALLLPGAMVAMARRSCPLAERGWMLALAVLAAAVFWWTRSKGAQLALCGGMGLAWLLLVRGRWRWLPVLGAVAGLVALSLAPGARAALAASAEVRWGYWQGAWELVRGAPLVGWGLDGFAQRFPQVMPAWCEPTRLVHNEPLEAWVVGGLPAGLALAGLLAWLPWRRPAVAERPAAAGEAGIAALAVAVAVPYLTVFGMLDGNLGWWPGAKGGLGVQVLWAMGLGGLLALVLWRGARIPPPPPWAIALGLGALALHALIDFDLHAGGVVGLVVAVACLGAAGGRSWTPSRWAPGVAGLVLAGCAAAIGLQALQAIEVRAAADQYEAVAALRAAKDPERRERIAGALAADLRLPAPGADARAQQEVAMTALADAFARAAADPALQVRILAACPPGAETVARAQELCRRMPVSGGARVVLAEQAGLAGEAELAFASWREAVALAPVDLNLAARAAAWCRIAAARRPALAAELLAQAAAWEREIARLAPVVHPKNRP